MSPAAAERPSRVEERLQSALGGEPRGTLRTLALGRVRAFSAPGSVTGVVLVFPAGHQRLADRVAGQLSAALLVPVSDATLGDLVAELLAVDSAIRDGLVLDAEALLDRVRLADRVVAWAQATAAGALADYAGEHTSDVGEERQRRFEVRVARSCSDDAAGADIAAARALAGPCRAVRDLWAAGEITGRHVFAVLDRTVLVDEPVTAEVIDRLVERLPGLSANRVRGEVTRLLAKVDPHGQAQRVRAARRHHVGVSYRSMPDGLAQIVATHKVEDARALMEIIDTTADRLLAHRRACPSCRADLADEIGPARAAAHYALVEHAASHLLDGDGGIDTGNVGEGAGIAAVDGASRSATGGDAAHGHRGTRGDDHGTSRTRGAKGRGRRSRRGELQLVIDLATLAGLAEHPCLVAGEPVPAEIARELVSECGSLRRVVTDPVTGYLLDYGTRVYLPDALVRFVQPRDGTCRSPGCAQPAWRCHTDHGEPFPRGPSSAGNLGALCKRDHDTKHAGGWRVTRRDPDGTLHWVTRDGQTGVTPPRPYLNLPTDDPPLTPPVAVDLPDDEPPF